MTTTKINLNENSWTQISGDSISPFLAVNESSQSIQICFADSEPAIDAPGHTLLPFGSLERYANGILYARGKGKLSFAGPTASLTNRPLFTSMAFLTWADAIIETKKQPVSWTPENEYYISSSTGNDLNDGSIGAPWQTLAKVQTELDAINDGSKTVFYFRRGDVWEETGTGTGISNNSSCIIQCNATQVGFDAYGSGAKPFFNRFVNKISSGWTVHSGGVYVQNVAYDVAYIRLVNDRLSPFYDASSAADCNNIGAETVGSFYYDAATGDLYVNAGIDPNLLEIEIADSNDEAFELSGDGCFAKNLRFDGHCSRTTRDEQAGFRLNVTGQETAMLSGCESYYGSSHLIHHNCFTATGGIAIIENCIAGYAMWNSAGETIFNSYAENGQQECYVKNCEVPFGTLPGHEWYSPTNTSNDRIRGQSFFCHTATGNETGFILVDGLKMDHNNPFGPSSGASNNNPPPVTGGLEESQVVFMNQTLDNSRPGLSCNRFAPLRGIGLNNLFKGSYGDNRATRAITNTAQHGWAINTVIDVSYPSGLANTHGVWNATNQDSSIHFDFCRIIQRPGVSNHDFRFNYDFSTTWADGELNNSVLARIGTYDESTSYLSGGASGDNNGTFGTKGAAAGTNETAIATESEATATTAAATVDIAANQAVGIVPEYDRFGNARNLLGGTTIGDIEYENQVSGGSDNSMAASYDFSQTGVEFSQTDIDFSME